MAKKKNPEEEEVKAESEVEVDAEAEEEEMIAPDSGPEEFISLPPDEEVLRLRKLPVKDLIDELFFSRQRLKNFLLERGVPVPEAVFVDESHKSLLDLGTSVYIESFSRREILSVPENAEAVNSTVKSFVMLFDSLISTNAFEEVMVSVEGVDEVMTVKQLLEDYDNSKVEEDKKVVVSIHDLRDQLEALIDEDSSGNKNLDDIDDDAIAATREMGDNEGITYRSKVGEGSYAFSEFSPFISEEMFNNLFSEEQANDEEGEAGDGFSDESELGDDAVFSDESELDEEESAGVAGGGGITDDMEVGDGPVFDDKSDVDKVDTTFASFDEKEPSEDDSEDEVAFDDFDSFDEKSAEINMTDSEGAISEDDIDTLMAAGSNKNVNNNAKMSADDIEAMMAEAEDVEVPAVKDEKVSADDIEAMMAEASEEDSSQDISVSEKDSSTESVPDANWEKTVEAKMKSAYDDSLISIDAQGADAGKVEKASVDDIDAMMAEAKAPSTAKVEKVSVDDIDAMMAEAKAPSTAKDEKVSADDIDAMMAEAKAPSTAKDEKVSADDIEAMMAEAQGEDSSLATPAPEEDSSKKSAPDENWEKTVEAKTKSAYNDSLITISGAESFDKDISGSSTKVKDPSEAVSMDKLVDFDTTIAPDEDWERTVNAKTKKEYEDDLINIQKIQEKLK